MTSGVRTLSMSPLSNVMTCMMKKLLLAAQLLLGLSLTSCGGEDAPLTRQQTSVVSASGEHITLSVGLDDGADSKARTMTVSSGVSDFLPRDEESSDSFGSYTYLRWRPTKKGTSKAVFTGEATEPVTLIFYHGTAAYPVAAQATSRRISLQPSRASRAHLSRLQVCSVRKVSMRRRGVSQSQLRRLSSRERRCRIFRCTSLRRRLVQAQR